MPPLLRPGTTIQARYRVVEVLGQGGMATTYRVDDLICGTPLALKLLRSDRTLLDAFRSEFALLTRLRHPHLARVRDFGIETTAGTTVCFYTADLVAGLPLSAFARSRSWSDVVRPLADAVEALAFLHRSGVCHGDFKPENILVGESGRGVLIDLGCARPLCGGTPDEVSGTKGYLAPELLEGRQPGPRADLYAVGRTIDDLRRRVSSGVPEAVARLASRLVEPDEGRRPADAAELLDLLDPREGPIVLSVASPLLGRQEQVEKADELIEALWQARPGPRVLWVTGPAGTGRSRLLAEIKWMAQLRGAVHEALHSEAAPVAAALARAAGTDAPRQGIEAVLEPIERLRRAGAPTVLVMDDVQRLTDGERAQLDAAVRSIAPSDPVVFLLASHEAPDRQGDLEATLEVGPLDEADVGRWSAGLVSSRNLRHLMRLSGGFPSLVERLLAALASGQLREDDLGSATAAALVGPEPASVEGIGGAERRALALIALCGGFADATLLDELAVGAAALESLEKARWLVAEATGWRLWRTADAPALLARWDQGMVTGLHAELAEATRRRLTALPADNPARIELEARLVVHLARASRVDEARDILEGSTGLAIAPRAWVAAAEAVAAAAPEDQALQVTKAAAYAEVGSPDRGLATLAQVLLGCSDPRRCFRARIVAARCYLKLGDIPRCIRQARRAAALASDRTERAAAADLRARALIQRGSYAEALDAARGAVDPGLGRAELAALHEDIGVASSYLGQNQAASDELRLAAGLIGEAGRPQDRARLLSYDAINEYRMGRPRKAADSYAAALEIAERFGLSDHIATGALNLGTACHQYGDLGRALECYERGLRAAVALGAGSTAIHLRLNLAKIYADIGSFDRAEAALTLLGGRIDGLDWLAGVAHSLAAQIACGRAEGGGARARLERAREIFRAIGSGREAAEVDLEIAELEWREGRLDHAEQALSSARQAGAGLASPDLLARIELAGGRLLAARGRADQALRLLESAERHAAEAAEHGLEAEVAEALAKASDLTDARFLARRHRARARELWERVAATLPASLHDAFWRHPKRADLAEVHGEESPGTAATSRVIRLMEINRQLSSSLHTEDVLRHTMDAAIELSGAERGFVILKRVRDDGGHDLHIPVARNLDREQLSRTHLKLSHGIAEKVLATGEAVFTVDALADERFRDNSSVHAMRLRSVACVPIRSPEGVVGALYLDNRFQRGRFREGDVTLLQAFADQAAIALRNARLVSELERRGAELEAERKKVEALVRAQAEEIDRLNEEVLASRPRQDTHRFDFSAIIGRSAAMQDVLGVLDRVVEAPWPVLIQGESGTGKELIARAVHQNGPRREGPFVAVNCAALPEPLLESELFGHVKGAFTGATRDRKGLFVEARGGTLFLDEIGEMPLEMQAKLLRVLEEHQVRPVGSEQVTVVDVRLVCATNRRLREEVAAGRFREDLFYRVSVMELNIPPLRDRVEDIPVLARHLLAEAAGEMGRDPPELNPRVLRKLARHAWPGNVRQLKNVLSKALVLAEGNDLTAADIELPKAEPERREARSRSDFARAESSRILAALNSTGWNVAEVSRTLGIPRSTLYRKLKRHGLIVPSTG